MTSKTYTVVSVTPTPGDDDKVIIALAPYLFFGQDLQMITSDRELAALQPGSIVTVLSNGKGTHALSKLTGDQPYAQASQQAAPDLDCPVPQDIKYPLANRSDG